MDTLDIRRVAYNQIIEKLEPGKVLVLYGPRRVGKTYILESIAEDLKETEKVSYLKGDQRIVKQAFSVENPISMMEFMGKGTTLLILDEAHKIKNIGENLKVLIDEYKDLKIIASGSASFDLSNRLGEPLTGRKKIVQMYPVSVKEIIQTKNRTYFDQAKENHIIYGGYPEVINHDSLNEKREYLHVLLDDYLFRDILDLDQIKNSDKLRDLLKLLAFQIGNEVSLSELGNSIDLHKDTVYRYLDLLEKSFIIFNVRGFSRNLRKEITKTSRWYFYDNGIRNALINNFNALNLRDDVGQLWENYIVMERVKKQSFDSIYSANYFWRTYDQKEIDWVEEREGKLFGYEFKWNPKKKPKAPVGWLETYRNATFEVVNKDNFLPFVI